MSIVMTLSGFMKKKKTTNNEKADVSYGGDASFLYLFSLFKKGQGILEGD